MGKAVPIMILVSTLLACAADEDDSFQPNAVQTLMREEARERDDEPASFLSRAELPRCPVVVQQRDLPAMECLRDAYDNGRPVEAAFESYRSGSDSRLEWWLIDEKGSVEYWLRQIDLGLYSQGEMTPHGAWTHAECDGLAFDERGHPLVYLAEEGGTMSTSPEGIRCTVADVADFAPVVPPDAAVAVDEFHQCLLDSPTQEDCILEW